MESKPFGHRISVFGPAFYFHTLHNPGPYIYECLQIYTGYSGHTAVIQKDHVQQGEFCDQILLYSALSYVTNVVA